MWAAEQQTEPRNIAVSQMAFISAELKELARMIDAALPADEQK